jgi:hypothetical protein
MKNHSGIKITIYLKKPVGTKKSNQITLKSLYVPKNGNLPKIQTIWRSTTSTIQQKKIPQL